MAFNYIRSQAVADKMITKYGMKAKLRRPAAADRDVIVVETDYTPIERQGKLVNPTSRIFLVSAKNLAQPPLYGTDVLVTLKAPDFTEDYEVLKIDQPPGRLSPGGIVIYWELAVSKV